VKSCAPPGAHGCAYLKKLSAFSRAATGKGKIAAIRRYREVFGCGLKEAKDAVESWTLQQTALQWLGTGFSAE
jgi:hypothetical protein